MFVESCESVYSRVDCAALSVEKPTANTQKHEFPTSVGVDAAAEANSILDVLSDVILFLASYPNFSFWPEATGNSTLKGRCMHA